MTRKCSTGPRRSRASTTASHVEGDVLVDDDVAKSREGFEPAHHLGGETRVPPEAPDRLGVVFETLAPPS
jgi:hypothetical protein